MSLLSDVVFIFELIVLTTNLEFLGRTITAFSERYPYLVGIKYKVVQI